MPRETVSRTTPLSAKAVDALLESTFVGGVAGLQMVISPGGTRSWRLFYRVAGGDGRRSAISLGRYPAISLAEARKRARAALNLAAEGRDPRHVRSETALRATFTFDGALAKYLEYCKGANEPKTVRDKTSAFRNHLDQNLRKRAISEVQRTDILSVLDGLADRPALRSNLYIYLRHFFGWAIERDLIDQHPLNAVKPPKTVPPRDRTLTDKEICAVMMATGVMADIARLLLLTGQRKGSVEAMRWADLDIERSLWSIPAETMKSSRPHIVPLSELAVAIIQRQQRLGGPFLFGVGSNGQKPYAGASKGFLGLKRQVGTDGWRLHDLRRTAVTLAQRGGAGLDEIRALTQHKTPGVIGVYARHAYAEEKQRVAQIIESEIKTLVGPQGGVDGGA